MKRVHIYMKHMKYTNRYEINIIVAYTKNKNGPAQWASDTPRSTTHLYVCSEIMCVFELPAITFYKLVEF